MNRRRKSVAAGVVVLAAVAGGVGYGVTQEGWFSDTATAGEASAAEAEGVLPTEEVTQGDLVESVEVVGDVGFGESWALAVEATGVVTERHEPGTLVEPGEPLIWIDTRPVFLVAGETPMYRTLEPTADAAGKKQSGPDVMQLETFLSNQGYDDNGKMTVDGTFGSATTRAVRAWQRDNGMEVTGTVSRSQIVFSPTGLRIDSAPRIGSAFADLQVTDSAEQITATFTIAQQPFASPGGAVDLDIGGGELVDGSISTVATAVDDAGVRSLKVTVMADQPLPDGIERVVIRSSRTLAEQVLVVPVRAVVALAGGGYALEVSTSVGTELRAAEIGAVVENRAEIIGDFAEGDLVVVPIDAVGG